MAAASGEAGDVPRKETRTAKAYADQSSLMGELEVSMLLQSHEDAELEEAAVEQEKAASAKRRAELDDPLAGKVIFPLTHMRITRTQGTTLRLCFLALLLTISMVRRRRVRIATLHTSHLFLNPPSQVIPSLYSLYRQFFYRPGDVSPPFDPNGDLYFSADLCRLTLLDTPKSNDQVQLSIRMSRPRDQTFRFIRENFQSIIDATLPETALALDSAANSVNISSHEIFSGSLNPTTVWSSGPEIRPERLGGECRQRRRECIVGGSTVAAQRCSLHWLGRTGLQAFD